VCVRVGDSLIFVTMKRITAPVILPFRPALRGFQVRAVPDHAEGRAAGCMCGLVHCLEPGWPLQAGWPQCLTQPQGHGLSCGRQDTRASACIDTSVQQQAVASEAACQTHNTVFCI
jgi:hypothetical protein